MIDYLQYLPWVFMAVGLVMLIAQRLAAEDEQKERFSRERDDQDEIFREYRKEGESSSTKSWIPEKPSEHRSRRRAKRETTIHYEIEAASPPPPASKSSPAWYTHMGGVVTLLVLLSALVVILMPGTYPDAHQKWAFGAIGTIVGFWLKH